MSKAQSLQGFLDEVQKNLGRGFSYDESFDRAGLTDAGRAYFAENANEKAAAFQEANPPATEKFDRQLKEKSKQEFINLVERLTLEPDVLQKAGFQPGRDAAWLYASNVDSEGKKLFDTWKSQARLGQKEELARRQALRGPSVQMG